VNRGTNFRVRQRLQQTCFCYSQDISQSAFKQYVVDQEVTSINYKLAQDYMLLWYNFDDSRLQYSISTIYLRWNCFCQYELISCERLSWIEKSVWISPWQLKLSQYQTKKLSAFGQTWQVCAYRLLSGLTKRVILVSL